MLHAFRAAAGRQAAIGACGCSRGHTEALLRFRHMQARSASRSSLKAQSSRQSDWASVTVFHALHKYYQDIKFKDSPPPVVPSAQLGQVEERLGYKFRSIFLLRLALLHTSAINKSPAPTLPLIGDAVLGLLVTEQCSASFPTASVGELTSARHNLQSREQCLANARSLGLQDLVVVGKGMLKWEGGDAEAWKVSSSVLAEAFEAVIGAVYLDGGLERARDVYTRCFPLPGSIRQAVLPRDK